MCSNIYIYIIIYIHFQQKNAVLYNCIVITLQNIEILQNNMVNSAVNAPHTFSTNSYKEKYSFLYTWKTIHKSI